jgi:phage-related protein
METYPSMYHHGTLVHTPIVDSEALAIDPAIRTPLEAGYTQSRARFTRTTTQWSLRYDMLKVANKVTLRAFELARLGGSDPFYWVNPVDGVTYTVRFKGVVTYTPVTETNNTRWTVTFTLEQQ